METAYASVGSAAGPGHWFRRGCFFWRHGAQDDAPCVLEGHIVEKLPRRKNRYLFEDHSGKVIVEIKNDVFGHLTVTPRDKVRLHGHIDWNRKRTNEVQVEALAITGTVDAHDSPGR